MLKIYIANLGKYNEGELVGKWVELPCEDLDEVLKEIEVVDGTASLLVITSRSNIIRKRSVRIPFVGNGAGQ